MIGGGGVVALSEADLVIRSSHARLGVLRPGHVVACIRITSHELLRDGVRAVAAFLFGRPHRDGFLSGSFSSFPPIWLEGNHPENQNLAVWFCVRPGPTPFFAFGTPARFRVTGAASCGHYAAGAAGKKNCRPPPLI